jgi:hypothetical protein
MKKIIFGIFLVIWIFVAFLFAIAPLIVALIIQNWLALLIYLGYPIIGYIFYVFWFLVFYAILIFLE